MEAIFSTGNLMIRLNTTGIFSTEKVVVSYKVGFSVWKTQTTFQFPRQIWLHLVCTQIALKLSFLGQLTPLWHCIQMLDSYHVELSYHFIISYPAIYKLNGLVTRLFTPSLFHLRFFTLQPRLFTLQFAVLWIHISRQLMVNFGLISWQSKQ